MRELDGGCIQDYQARYGVLADQPITDWDFPHTEVDAAEYERVWNEAREHLESR